jgi:hypothetical protein
MRLGECRRHETLSLKELPFQPLTPTPQASLGGIERTIFQPHNKMTRFVRENQAPSEETQDAWLRGSISQRLSFVRGGSSTESVPASICIPGLGPGIEMIGVAGREVRYPEV